MARPKKSTPKPGDAHEAKLFKLRKILPSGVPEDLEALDRDGLLKVIADCEENVREQEDLMDEDEALAGAKERVSDLSGAYKDSIKAQRAKQRYASMVLDGKGRPVSISDAVEAIARAVAATTDVEAN